MSTELIIFSVFSLLAGILFCILILACNWDSFSHKVHRGWYIPAIGFFLAYSVCIPLFAFFNAQGNQTVSIVLQWVMGVLLIISSISWIIGKIVSQK